MVVPVDQGESLRGFESRMRGLNGTLRGSEVLADHDIEVLCCGWGGYLRKA